MILQFINAKNVMLNLQKMKLKLKKKATSKINKKLIPLAGSSGSYPERRTRFLLTIYEH